MKRKNIALVSFWLKCIDGVSIEADKWAKIYEGRGHRVFLVAGRFEEKTDRKNLCIEEMDFMHPKPRTIKRLAFESHLSEEERTHFLELVRLMKEKIKPPLREFFLKNKIDLLSVENVFSLPLNIPLTIALKEVIEELMLPCIIRHHDFYWERLYFMRHYNIPDILHAYFPPKFTRARVRHVVINKVAQLRLMRGRNINSIIIPDSIDFDNVVKKDKSNKSFRKDLGIGRSQFIFLQPTRIVERKKIERSIRLVQGINKLTKKSNVLLITGPPLYPVGPYCRKLLKLAEEAGVELVRADEVIGMKRSFHGSKRIYSIHDAYAHSDVVTFPSDTEGFGLPVLEAAANKKPLFVNKYVNLGEITSKGFEFVTINKRVTKRAVKKLYELLTNAKKKREVTKKNFELAYKHYSLEAIGKQLEPIISELSTPSLGTALREIIRLMDKTSNLPLARTSSKARYFLSPKARKKHSRVKTKS